MRRFSVLMFALACLFGVVSSRKDPADTPKEKQSASADAGRIDTADRPATPGQPSNEKPDPSRAADQSVADPLMKTAALVAKPVDQGEAHRSDLTTATSEKHQPAKTAGVDPALADMDPGDLNRVAQKELKRLGCYGGKLDGKWGRKSRAAMKIFVEHAGGAWADSPGLETITAFRNYPQNFCGTECTVRTEAGQCVIASAPGGSQTSAGPKDDQGSDQPKEATDTSYLPPWMQGAKLTSPEPSALVAPDAGKALSEVAPGDLKPKKRKSVRRGGGERQRIVQGYEGRKWRGRNWLPKSWPGRD